MKRMLAAFAVLAIAASSAWSQPIAYSNITTPTGFAFTSGPSANQGGNQVTFCDFDDINFVPGFANGQWSIRDIIWSSFNNNPGDVSARMTLVFYDNNGAGGAPGTRIGSITFNATTLTSGLFAGQAWIFTLTDPLAFPILPNGGSFFAGLYFDNDSGATGATAGQMDNLGQVLYDPPTIGTSANQGWEPTNQGDPGVNNPGGAFFQFPGGTPVANNFFQFTVQAIPEPTTWALLGLSAAGAAAWRRWAGRAAKAQAEQLFAENA